MKKLLVSLLLVLGLGAGVLAGCGPRKGGDGKTITVWGEAIGSETAVMDEFTAYFNANNGKGYTMEFVPKENLSGDLRSAIQGRNAPNLVIWPRWETVTKSNLLQDLSAKIAESGIQLSDYNAGARSELELDGKVYGIGTDIDAWGIWCNMKIFQDAGVTEMPTTWAELKSTAEKLTSGSGANMIAGLDTYNMRGQFYTFLLTAGHQFIDNSGSVPVVNVDVNDKSSASYKAMEDVLTYFKTMFDMGVPSGYEQLEYFTSNKVAMKFGPSNYSKTIENTIGEAMDLKFIGNPAKSATEGKISGILGGYSLAVPRGSDLDLGFEIIEWWTQEANMTKYCELYDLLPANTKLWDSAYITENETLTTMKSIIPNYEVRPVVRGYSNLESNVVFAAMDELRLGTKTVAQTIENIKKQGDDVLQLENMM